MRKIYVDSKMIRKKMIDKDITTIIELSRQSGVSKPKIHQYLSGKTPLATTFARLCTFLELSPEETIIIENTDDDDEKETVEENKEENKEEK